MHHVTIVRATNADILDLFEWRNEPSTRSVSKNKDPIDWDTHAAWFAAVLASPERTIHMGFCESRKIGWIRFDRMRSAEGRFLVSILVAPGERGRGMGKALLHAGIAMLPNSELEAEIAIDNHASQRIFEACGFERVPDESGSEFLTYRRAPIAPVGG
jgi:RimJ/RimL family protein N-acetyltransferase